MAIIGGFFFVFGLVDLIGSFAGFDLWGQWIGVELPEILWRFSAYIEMAIGGLLFKFGSGETDGS